MFTGLIYSAIQGNKATGGGSSDDTNADNQQVIGVLGESHMLGVSSPGTTLPNAISGAVFQWNSGASQIQMVVGSHMLGETNGAPWIPYGNAVFTSTGKKTIIVNAAVGNSTAWPDPGQPTNTWYTSGTLYSTFVSRITAAMAAAGVTKPKAIYIGLGTNDCQASSALTDVATGMQSLITRLLADFPGVDIVWAPTGYLNNTAIITDPNNISGVRQLTIRKILDQLVKNNTRVFKGPTMASLSQNGYNQTNNVHLNDDGNINWGGQWARWYINSSLTKEARYIACCQFVDMSPANLAVMEAIIAGIGLNDWYLLDLIHWFKSSDRRNFFADLRGQTSIVDRGAQNSNPFGFTANQFITFDGLASNGKIASFNYKIKYGTNDISYASQDNFFQGVKLVANRSTGVAAALFGGGSASGASIGSRSVRQRSTASGGGVLWRAATQTDTTFAAEGDLDPNTFYGLIRTASGVSGFIKNITIDQTSAVASTGPGLDGGGIGARTSLDAPLEYMNCDVEYAVAGDPSVNWQNVITRLNTGAAAWTS
jgi:hypothetical protein